MAPKFIRWLISMVLDEGGGVSDGKITKREVDIRGWTLGKFLHHDPQYERGGMIWIEDRRRRNGAARVSRDWFHFVGANVFLDDLLDIAPASKTKFEAI
ncbi:hypothetical protein EYC80_002452 [Monilinia laxa]|uniref:Uncharacterized protein n=1 Tax=Monilinia laxa TaxID=61186 RepID=A0A5N6K3U7_MONLA|nr:hypothetical protein EYC80_002452 [Monilinia laxa]